MNYRSWHTKLYRLKGKPGPCVLCGEDESHNEWALVKSEQVPGEFRWVEDPEKYQAMCKSCHRKMDFEGWVASDELRALRRATHLGKQASEETREKMRAAARDRSPEAKAAKSAKISAKARKRYESLEFRVRQSAATTERLKSPETRAKMSAAASARSFESRQRIWETRRARYGRTGRKLKEST